ncbi:hypothetical protein PIB30_038041 [Stylosanthes scabra]|uniref:Uncharacterized protein n=1 Tax=Stylosanthes scabra TaxID=79078 RepID=A0ABU6UFV8_9FABA|nr:hypothetical protein [Stylosanthes scabra]
MSPHRIRASRIAKQSQPHDAHLTASSPGVKIPHVVGIPARNVRNENSKAGNFFRGDEDRGQNLSEAVAGT